MESNIIAEATQIIKTFEGFRSVVYYDGTADYSIGYGFTIWKHRPVTATYPVSITQDEANDELETLVESVYSQILNVVTVTLTDNQAVALCSFVYNVGIGNFKSSTMLKDINAGDFTSAGSQFPLWNKSGGIVVSGLSNRRAIEQKIFETA